MAISMESVQASSAAPAPKQMQSAGEVHANNATLISFMQILNELRTGGGATKENRLEAAMTEAKAAGIATDPESVDADETGIDSNAMQALMGLLASIKDALASGKGPAAKSDGEQAHELQRMVGTVMSGLTSAGSAQTLNPGSTRKADPLQAAMDLLGEITAALSQAEAPGLKGKGPAESGRHMMAAATGANASDSGSALEKSSAEGKILPTREGSRDVAESGAKNQGQGTPAISIVSETAEGKTEVDLAALRKLLQEQRQTAGAGANALATDAQDGMASDPFRQKLLQTLADMGGAKADVIALKIRESGMEKKISLRGDRVAASQSLQTESTDAKGGITPSSAGASDEISAEVTPSPKKAEALVNKDHKPQEKTEAVFAGRDARENAAPGKDSTGDPAGSKVAEARVERGDVEKKTAPVKEPLLQMAQRNEQGAVAGVTVISGSGNDEKRIESQSVIRQVAEGAESALNSGTSRVRMELNPPRLGALDMDLVVSHDRVKMVILADSHDVRNILQSNMDQLRSALQQQGLKMDGVDVFVQDRSAGGQTGDLSGHAWGQSGGHSGQLQEGRYFGSGWSENGPATEPIPEQMARPVGRTQDGTGLNVFA